MAKDLRRETAERVVPGGYRKPHPCRGSGREGMRVHPLQGVLGLGR